MPRQSKKRQQQMFTNDDISGASCSTELPSEVTGKPFSSLNIAALKEFNIENDNWEIYKERLEQYFVVNAVEECRKVPVLISIMGDEAYSFLKDLCYPELPKNMDFDSVCKVMGRHFISRAAIFKERIKFYKLVQNQEESVADWFARLKKAVGNCKFGNILDEILKDRFVCGLKEGSIQDRLCEEDPNECRLMDLVELALKRESATANRREGEIDKRVYSVNKNKSNQLTQNLKVSEIGCKVCGKKNHLAISCYYKNFRCRKCKKMGHLASVCRATVNSLEVSSDVESSELNTVEMLRVDEEHQVEAILVKLQIADKEVEMLVDTGAGVTIVPYDLYEKEMTHLPLRKIEINLKAFGGGLVKPAGEVTALVKWNGKIKECKFLVVPKVSRALLGRDWLRKFGYNFNNIFSVANDTEESLQVILKEYKDLFREGLGCYKYEKVKLRLKDGVIPKFYKPRPIPFAFREQVDQQLMHLEEGGIIERVSNSSWGTPLVPVIKPDGSIRICANYKITVNDHLVDELHPLPRIEELLAALQGGQKFSKLDFKQAYNQLELDESSQDILAWSTHKGIFKMKRLPFGTKPAVAIFQKIVEKCLQGLPGVGNFLDDIIVTGSNSEEHLRNLRSVFNRMREAGFTLNLNKCEFFKAEVKYLGHIIDERGVRMDTKKVEALKEMRRPNSITEVRSFLGAINYYSKFLKNFATILAPLYNLLQKTVPFKWSYECENAFNQIKKELLSDKVLIHFNPRLPLRIYCDASKVGIGAVLFHVLPDGEERPVAFASRVLNKAERNYSMIHKEALAIYWGMKKFYQYLMGRPIEVMCDHKPLQALFGEKKGIPEMAAGRLQRWALFISGFKYTFRYIKGEKNRADGFYRLPLETEQEYSEEEDYVNLVEGILDVDLQTIKTETEKDGTLQKVLCFVREGWPDSIAEEELKPFAQKKDELWTDNGILMWGYRLVIPKIFRHILIKELHSSHKGISKMKTQARSYFWWPLLDLDIENFVKRCEACSAVRNNPKKVDVKQWPETTRPFERVHIDYIGPFKGKRFLLLTDSYSKWPEVFEVRNPNSGSTIQVLREIFARFGLPEMLVSDNGTPFASAEFHSFCVGNKIQHVFSPPYHPQSNGAAENGVGSFKRGIYKFLNDRNSAKLSLDVGIKRYLFHYRTSIHCKTGDTPARRMFGRELRTRIDVLKKRFSANKEGREEEENEERKKFVVGEIALSRTYKENSNGKKWEKGRVEKLLGSRCYLVRELSSGIVQKRHVDQLLKIPEERRE